MPTPRTAGSTRLRVGLATRSQPAVRRLFIAHAAAVACAATVPDRGHLGQEVIDGGNSAYGIVLSAWGAGPS